MAARFSFLWVLIWLVTSQAAADGGDWTVIQRERGITVSRRVQAGSALPAFRGQGRIRGNVLQVLAVMLDLNAVGRWAYGVSESRPIRRIDERTHLLYLRSHLPWPLRDRDMIVRSSVEVLRPGAEFRVTLRCEPGAQAEREEAIRVKRCESTLHLRQVDAESTEVDYVMSLDPAGRVPRWSAEWVAKATPFKTLVALEARAATAASQQKYAAFVRDWSAAM